MSEPARKTPLADPFPVGVPTPISCAESPSAAILRRATDPQHAKIQLVFDGPYAFARLSNATQGSEALLERRHGEWCVVTQGGGELDLTALRASGMSNYDAQRLYNRMGRHAGEGPAR